MTSEIFNCEINALLDKFFDAPDHTKKEEGEESEDKEVLISCINHYFQN
jgi:hypothetical protein